MALLAALIRHSMFDEVILSVLRIATMPIKVEAGLPQVHALNCLKEAFTDGNIGSRAQPFLTQTIVACVDCLDSDM